MNYNSNVFNTTTDELKSQMNEDIDNYLSDPMIDY